MERFWPLKFWALIGALIALAIGLSVVFSLTLQASRSVETWNRMYMTWYASQLEVEFWRLLDAASRYANGDLGVDRADIEQRIDVLSARIGVFDAGLGRDRLLQLPGGSDTIVAVKRALDRAAPRLEALRPGDRPGFAPIRDDLAALGPPLKSLSLNFEHFETEGAIGAIRSLQGYFILGAALIAAILLVGIILVGFLVLEIGVRRRLFDDLLASKEQARIAQEREKATLIESGRRFNAIAMANPVALLVADRREGTLRYANPAAVALFGLPEGEASRARMADFFLDPAPLGAVLKSDATAMPDHLEARLRHADGSEFPAALSAGALDYDGTASVVVGILDLTEKQAAQAEIERQREVIYHREKLGALGSLLAGVAHELNNPLSIVVAQATLLEELTSDSNTILRASKIRTAAERCARIVKTFLAMARQRPPSRAEVDLNEAVNAALELLGYSLRTASIEVQRQLDPALPRIWADSDQISQILTNLIINAQQALAEWTGPRLLTITTASDQGSPMVELAISDSGPGVPVAIRSRIFEPFFTTKPIGVGTGIGLSVCHSMVTAHGGTITLRDPPGGGSSFVLQLPIGRAGAVASATAGGATADTPRALIVDDEPEVAGTLAEILSRGGYRIDLAESGQAALDRLGSTDYAVVISDVRMPNMDGMELYRRIKALRPDIAARFILVTGDALSPAVVSFLSDSGRPHIEKPFIPAEIRKLVAATAGIAERTPSTARRAAGG
jgi:PAS domain S-box-containing protein